MLKKLTLSLLTLLASQSLALEIQTQNSSDKNMKEFFQETVPVYQEEYPKVKKFIDFPSDLQKLTLTISEENVEGDDVIDKKQELIFRRRWAERHAGKDFAVYSELTRVLLRETKADLNNWIVQAIPDYVAKELYGREPWWFPVVLKSYDTDPWASADFLTFIAQKTSKEKLNQVFQVCYKGEYKEQIFKDILGKDLKTLWADYKHEHDPHREDLELEISMNIERAPGFQKEAKIIKEQSKKLLLELEKLLWVEGYRPLKKLNLFLARNVGAPGFSNAPRAVIIDADFFRRAPKNYNLIVHELTHCVQNYPEYVVWVTEGIADLMSYKLGYRTDVGSPKPGGSYKHGYSRAASFLLWLENKMDKDIVIKLHKLLRKGEYKPQFFIDNYEKDVDTLWAEFQVEIAAQQQVTTDSEE